LILLLCSLHYIPLEASKQATPNMHEHSVNNRSLRFEEIGCIILLHREFPRNIIFDEKILMLIAKMHANTKILTTISFVKILVLVQSAKEYLKSRIEN